MRTTITINDALYRALKHRALESGITVSSLVENSIKYQLLEDLEDLEDASQRQHESELSFNGLVLELRSEGLL